MLLENTGEGEHGRVAQEPEWSMEVTSSGLAALPKKTVGKTLAFEYIDFNEFPPSEGEESVLATVARRASCGSTSSRPGADQNVDPRSGNVDPVFFSVAATLLPHHPGRLAEFMAYQSIIAKTSTRYKWPSRIIYDQSFRQDVESNPSQSLATVEPCIYAPAGHSVNDGIEKELSSLHYISIDDVVACIVRLGKDTILAKIDVKQAYRIVPLNPSDRQLLGMLWGRQSVC